MSLQYSEPLEHGRLIINSVAAPGANTEMAVTFSSQNVHQIIGVTLTFTADANAATRTFALTLDDGTNIVWRVFSGANSIANAVNNDCFAAGLASGQFVNTIGAHIALPYPFSFVGSFVLRTVTNNMQVGDAYTNIVIATRVWIP